MPKALQRGEAETRCRRRYSGDRYHSGGFLLRAMPPSCILPPPAYAILQAGHSSLPQRKLESDAEFCRGGDCRHSGGFLLRIMPPSWHPVPACVRYGILQAKPFSIAATENRIGRGPRCRTATAGGPFLIAAARTLHRFPSLALKSRIDARRRA